MGRALLHSSLAWEPFLRLVRRHRLASRVMVLMYHEVLPDGEGPDAWTVVRESDFVRQVEYLRAEFDVVTLEEAREALAGRRAGREHLAVITFDDGYLGNARVAAPIADALDVPITIFLATDWIARKTLHWFDDVIVAVDQAGPVTIDLSAFTLGRYAIAAAGTGAARWTAVQALLTDLKRLAPSARGEAVRAACEQAAGVGRPRAGLAPMTPADVARLGQSRWITIGAHSHCHSLLCQIPEAEARGSVERSRQLAREWSGQPVRHFAYPNGNYTPSVVRLVREAGFDVAVTTQARAWSASDSLLAVPRCGVGGYDSMATFRTRASNLGI